MPAANENTVGPGTTLHRATLIATPNETSIEAAAVAAALVGNLESLTAPNPTREMYDRKLLNTYSNLPVPGRISLGQLEFSLFFDASNVLHVAIRDDDKRTALSYIITLNQPGTAANKTFCHVAGIVSESSVTEFSDSQIMLNCVVMCTTDLTWVDNS